MPKTVTSIDKLTTRAFTLIEALICLLIITSSILLLSLPIRGIYSKVEEQLFFLSFENCYRHSRKVSLLRQKEHYFQVSEKKIRFEEQELTIPNSVKALGSHKIRLNKLGGNHSLAKITFKTGAQEITYQLNLGSGTYRKTSR
ncbi:type II secretion system protein [Streptococcus iniae]|uniref:Competence protein n=1 Tax=Streptococcus iniae TaxID=1346 RepID=A0A1J0MX24_STRIN|nr:competence type IV pilus minor pilin ComGD [Streptococcus iniae]AGM97958.1 competence protein [Streptococcus iniae SF1]AHY15041.1 competence protein [Streptococcus iniae]AHY16912.1 competence protein [Streptococcus iniae]AJG25199.1 competence protein [Streptococcus iniae]APD31101.1 competence protein [Streptococcus iniae]